MRVILLKDVDKLGKRYEVKRVKNGYARNFLIPKGLAKLATKQTLKWLEKQKEIIKRQAEERLAEIQKVASKLDGQEITIPVETGKKGQLFEGVTAQKIAQELKKHGFSIKKSQIDLAKPIKEIGEFPVKIRLDEGLEAEINLIISEKK